MKKQASNHVSRKLSESDGEPAGRVSGQFVTEMFEYDGGRQVTVYVPQDPPELIVFAGDGQGISKWGRLLEKVDVPSTMIVGVYGLTDETLRLHEYSPGFEPERFAAHEKCFVEDVRRWTESRFGVALPTKRTAVFGVSAGGELALARSRMGRSGIRNNCGRSCAPGCRTTWFPEPSSRWIAFR